MFLRSAFPTISTSATTPKDCSLPDFWKHGTAVTQDTDELPHLGDAVVPVYSGDLTRVAAIRTNPSAYPDIVGRREGANFDPNDSSTWPPTHVQFTYLPKMIRKVISDVTSIDISTDQAFWDTEYTSPNLLEQRNALFGSCSPVRLLVTDPLGRQAGLDLNTGQVINEIPGAFVSEDGVDPQLMLLPEIAGEYIVHGVGIDQGDYRIFAILGDDPPIVERTLEGSTDLGQSYQFTFGSPLPQESGGQVVLEAERFTYQVGHSDRTWLTQTTLSNYSGSSYLSASPDIDQIFTTAYTTTSPELLYTINFTTTGTYYVWLRGYAPNGAGDSVYVTLGEGQVTVLSGFLPRQWSWANGTTLDASFTVEVATPGLYTLHLWQREDGLKIDRILLTTDNSYIPIGSGP